MNNRSAKLKINKGQAWCLNIFHCQLPPCCNFISSVGDKSIKYCSSHLDYSSHIKKRFLHPKLKMISPKKLVNYMEVQIE